MKMKVGEAIRKYRDVHSLSTGEFAKLSGLSKPYVWMLEANKNSNGGKPITPSTATLLKVSKVLNIPVSNLIDETIEEADIVSPTNSDDENVMLDQYRRLNDADKKTIRFMMDRFLQPVTSQVGA